MYSILYIVMWRCVWQLFIKDVYDDDDPTIDLIHTSQTPTAGVSLIGRHTEFSRGRQITVAREASLSHGCRLLFTLCGNKHACLLMIKPMQRHFLWPNYVLGENKGRKRCKPVLLQLSLTPCFRKKTPTHINGYKLRNSCLILIIFDTKIPHIFDIARQFSCPPHLTNVATLPCKTHSTSFVAVHYKHALFCDKKVIMGLISNHFSTSYKSLLDSGQQTLHLNIRICRAGVDNFTTHSSVTFASGLGC